MRYSTPVATPGAVLRIVLHEHFSSLPPGAAPDDLRRAGRAMRDAIASDLAALPGVEVQVIGRARRPRAALRRALAGAGAALVIAPENGGRLERLAALVEGSSRNLGPGPRAVRLAADKLATFRLLRAARLATPATRPVPAGRRGHRLLAALPLPFVLKPRDGCGSAGVTLVRRAAEIAASLLRARAAAAGGGVLVQEHVAGTPISVTLIVPPRADGARTPESMLLGICRQTLRGRAVLRYTGGEAPLRDRRGGAAARLALRAVAILGRRAPDLRGIIGVDLVLSPAGPVLIEINPRPTTSWIGLRRLARSNPAAHLLEAVPDRRRPVRARLRGACRFSAGGRVVLTGAAR